MQHADDCAFIGFDTEGPDGEAPTQIGLAYLPGLPTIESVPRLLGAIRRLKNKLEGCQMRCLSVKNSRHDPQLHPGGHHCSYAINAIVDSSEVQMRLVDLMFEWKMKSKKKFMVLVGFGLNMDMYTLLSQWPVVLNFLDGWVDTQDLATENIDVRRQRPDRYLSSTPGLKRYINGLGIHNEGRGSGQTHNAAIDAMMALLLLLIIWKGCLEETTPYFYFDPPQSKRKGLSRGAEKRLKNRGDRLRGTTLESEHVDNYDYGCLFDSTQ
ncbi:hypothetical protein PG984_009040 [Apiospora sp. TS-2023a]